MMNFQEFVGCIAEEFGNKISGLVQVVPVTKNNNVTLTGLTVTCEESNISPTIYLEGYYEAYKQGKNFYEIVAEIHAVYTENKTKKNFDSAVSRLKMLTGGDSINLNQKYVDEFRYRNRAKFIFATNFAIQLAEDDEAFWSRMVFLPFDYSVSKEEQNTELLNELLEEKDAIVSKALKYARKLIKNNYEFPTTPEIEKRIRQWRGIEEDSINEFIKKCCYINSECRGELMEDLYAAYLQFCADIDVKAVKRAALKQYLEKQIGLVHFKMRRGNTDNAQSAFRGIVLLTRGGSL